MALDRQYQAMPDPTTDVASLQKALKAAISNIEVLCGMKKAVPGIADQLTDLRSTRDGINARFTEYVEVSTANNVALVQRTTTLEADMYGTNGRVSTVDKARADGDSALAQRITTIEADYKATDGYLNGQIVNTNARVQQVDTARSDGDGALAQRITTIDAAYKTADNDIKASVTSEATARANADGAIATSVSNVDAKYNGFFANGSIKFSAGATPTGWNASFELSLTGGLVGGATVFAGMQIYLRSAGANSYESAIVFSANNFLFQDPTIGAARPVFNYGSGIFTFNVPVIVRGTDLQTNATQNSQYGRQDAGTVTVALNVRNGAKVHILAQFEGRPAQPFAVGSNHTLQVYRTDANGNGRQDLIAKFMNYYVAGNNNNTAVYYIEANANLEDTPPVNGAVQQFNYTITNSTGLGICNIRVQEFFR